MKFEEIDGNCDLCSLKGEFCSRNKTKRIKGGQINAELW